MILSARKLSIMFQISRTFHGEVLGATKGTYLIDLDTGNNVVLLQELNEGLAGSVVGHKSLFEQDDTRNVLVEAY